jgi:hypothetical protein
MPAARDPNVNSGRNSPKPPPAKIYGLNEPPFEGFKPVDADGFKKSDRGTAIVVDMGKSSHPTQHNPYEADILYRIVHRTSRMGF